MSSATPNRLLLPGFVLNTGSTTAPSLTTPSLNTAYLNQVVTVGSDSYFVDATGVAKKLGSSSALTTTSLTPKVWNGTTFVNAQASTNTALADVIQLSDGSYIHDGKVTWTGHGLTVGNWYYTSQTTAGGYVTPQPSTGWSQQLFFVLDANTILVDIEQGSSATAAADTSPYLITMYRGSNDALLGGFAVSQNKYNLIDTSASTANALSAANTTTFRITPTRPGFYDVTAAYSVYRTPTDDVSLVLRKNGANVAFYSTFGGNNLQVRKIVYLNGTTDYVDAINIGGTANAARFQSIQNAYLQVRWLHA